MKLNPMQLRWLSRISVATLVVVVAVVIVLHNRSGDAPKTSAAATLHGIDLSATAAPDFTLHDPSGKAVSLASERGHVVVLTFFYTHCPDECPITAQKLATAAQAMGSKAQDVVWLAVSVDPVGDTPQSADSFVKTHNLTGRLVYLLGTHAQLAPVWDAYHVAVQPTGEDTTQIQTVNHSLGVYVINGTGHEVEFFDVDFKPADLASDLTTVMKG